MANSIHVMRTYCPFWQREVYELWNNLSPVIPANNYIRSNLILNDHTLADKAYSLVLFFRFLQRNSLDFFDLSPSVLNPLILQFRNELLFRVRAKESISDVSTHTRTEVGVPPISYSRAQSVLAEVGWLCNWWGVIEARPSRKVGSYGKIHPQSLGEPLSSYFLLISELTFLKPEKDFGRIMFSNLPR